MTRRYGRAPRGERVAEGTPAGHWRTLTLLAWSKIKQQLRSAKARTVESLEAAITHALAQVTANNASAWFAHCGYAIQ